MAQTVKNPPAMRQMQETWVQSLGREGPLEEGMATHSSVLAWRIPQTEEPGGLQSTRLQRVRHNWSNLACTLVKSLYLDIIFCFLYFRKERRKQEKENEEEKKERRKNWLR